MRNSALPAALGPCLDALEHPTFHREVSELHQDEVEHRQPRAHETRGTLESGPQLRCVGTLHDAVRAGLAGIVNEGILAEAAAAIPELRDPRPNGPRGASIVIARLALNCALATTTSPRIAAATSASVALQRMCHGRSNGEPAQIGTAESVSKIKRASSRVSPSGHLLGHPRETTMIVRMYVNRAGGPSRAGRPPGQGFANVARLPGIALSSRLHLLQPGSTRLATAVRDSASA